MNFNLLKETESKLLERKRLTFEIDHQKEATPNRENVKKEIAKKAKVNENLVAIRHIYSKFGTCKTKVIAHIYSKDSDLNFFEKKKEVKKPKEENVKENGKETNKK